MEHDDISSESSEEMSTYSSAQNDSSDDERSCNESTETEFSGFEETPFQHAVILDPIDREHLGLETPPKNDISQHTHRSKASSLFSMSGYETAQQTPTNDFISSCSGDIMQPRSDQLTKHTYDMKSPTDSIGDDSFYTNQVVSEEKKSPNNASTSNRERLTSDEIYEQMQMQAKADNQNRLKFYEDDFDSSSIVFRRQSSVESEKDLKNHFPSMSSIGTMGSGSGSDGFNEIIEDSNKPQHDRNGSNPHDESFTTQRISNVTQRDTIQTNIYSQPQPQVIKDQPLGLPPSGISRKKLLSKEFPGQYYQNEEGYSSSSRPPSLHIRGESSGSVSSLGSTMDGATTLTQRQFQQLNHQLRGELNDYGNGNKADHQSRGRQKKSNEKHHGVFNNIFDSMSITSTGSGRSIADERADYRKKGQKILKETERKKQRANKKGWFSNNDRGSIRSMSPANRSQRSHRPKLPSIDNDTWDEDEDDEVEEKTMQKSKRKTSHSHRDSRHTQRPPRGGNHSYGNARTSRKFESTSNGRRGKLYNNYHHMQQQYEIGSDESESSEEESYISNDFTSNQFVDTEKSPYYSNESDSDKYISYDEEEANERTSLISPSGISTEEGESSAERAKTYNSRSYSSQNQSRKSREDAKFGGKYSRYSDRSRIDKYRDQRYVDKKSRSKKNDSKSRQYGSRHRNMYYEEDASSSSYSDDYAMSRDEQRKFEARIRKQLLKEIDEQRCCNRFGRWLSSKFVSFMGSCKSWRIKSESFVSNLPLTIGAVGLAIVTLGVVWFKFAEEMMNSCKPVHFHSQQCQFPEFPGCFYCDTSVRLYKVALNFHEVCSLFAGVIAFLFVLKIFLARKVVIDEMYSPTTSSPAGLICMTIVCVAAGRGLIGQFFVTLAAAIHFCVAVWFIFMAGHYGILPDPSWYPNTVGIGISAVKTWLYYPEVGHFLMLICFALCFSFFPISLYRVTANKKISAPVSWIQMSAPAVTLYAMTIMAQPSFEEEHPDLTEFQRIRRQFYLPAMHFLFFFAVLGALSSAQSLYTRWDTFKKLPFSPAHAAFCFPTLAHANCIQAYRSAIKTFSRITATSKYQRVIDAYWLFVLICGTITTLIFTAKFIYKLPEWTSVDVEDEEEPPARNETQIPIGQVGDQWDDFVSVAVLQANETGALVSVVENGEKKLKRTRRVTALGFEPIMSELDFENERDRLLEWAARNPARERNRTVSFSSFGRITNRINDVQDFRDNDNNPIQGGRTNAYNPSSRRTNTIV